MKMVTNTIHLVFVLLIFGLAPLSSASFCVCKSGLQTAAYQKAIDYACGAGADCNPIRPNGQCYNPNSIQGHCSFAANSYYQKNAAKGATCDFQGTAVLTNSDPSGGGCSYSASSGSTSTGTPTPITNVPTTSPTTPSTTPVTPVYGGGGGGGGTIPITPVSGSGTPTSGTGTGQGQGQGQGTGTGTGTGMGTGTGTGTGMTPTTTSPYTPNVGNPTSTGVLGGSGFGTGLAPTGSMDDNHGTKSESMSLWSALIATMMLGIMYM